MEFGKFATFSVCCSNYIRCLKAGYRASAAPARGYEYICLVLFRINEACFVDFENSEISGACIVHLRISFRSRGNRHCVDIV